MEPTEQARLERLITEEQSLLHRYERRLETEQDPRECLRLEREIERIKTLVLGYQTRLVKTQPNPLPAVATVSILLANAPYGLSSELVGRDTELGLLDDWYGRDRKHPLLTIIGLGGMGKSALTWAWLQQLREQGQAPPLVVWWSFYETDGTLDKMLAAILQHLGEEPQGLTLREAVNRFGVYTQRQPMLLMLDGAERLLKAYQGMGAAYQGDETGRGQRMRQCVDPVVGHLLGWLSQPSLHQAQTVMTSRLFPQDLTDRSGQKLVGVERVDLLGLSPEAAYELFRQKGVATTRAEVQQVCEPLGYHPLTLQILAGYVGDSLLGKRELRQAVGYDPTLDLLGKRTHVLQRAYDNLPLTAQRLLSHLAAFRSGVTLEVLKAVFGKGELGATLARDLRLLNQRSLVQVSELDGQQQIDLHPIVRRYAYDRLADPAGTHSQLVGYFEAVPEPSKVTRLADLLPTIELYHHLTQAERYDEASILYRDRLSSSLYYQLGEYKTCIQLLQAVFPNGEKELPRLQNESDQAWVLNELAVSYHTTGNPAGAIPLFKQHNTIREKQNDKRNLLAGLINLATEQLALGRLSPAGEILRHITALSREIGFLKGEAIGHQGLGRTLTFSGDYATASQELITALQQFTGESDIRSQGVIWAYRAWLSLLQGEVKTALTSAQQALDFAKEIARAQHPYERDFVQAYWLLGWASFATGDTATSTQHLDTALRRCRAINLVEFEPPVLLAQARLARAQGQPSQAVSIAAEARHIAERSGYRLDLADIHNLLAQLALDTGDTPTAQQEAQTAKEYAWCDGPPHAYASALAEAERILALVSS